MEIYMHDASGESPRLLEVDAERPARHLLEAENEVLWVEGNDEPLDLDASLQDAGVGKRAHLHQGRCHKIDVQVRYNSETRSKRFAPAVTVAAVFAWTSGPKGFELTGEQRATHALAIQGADHTLDSTVHIGSLIKSGTCEVELDLVPKERFAG